MIPKAQRPKEIKTPVLQRIPTEGIKMYSNHISDIKSNIKRHEHSYNSKIEIQLSASG